jgi:acetyl esterase/lipase
MNKY